MSRQSKRTKNGRGCMSCLTAVILLLVGTIFLSVQCNPNSPPQKEMSNSHEQLSKPSDSEPAPSQQPDPINKETIKPVPSNKLQSQPDGFSQPPTPKGAPNVSGYRNKYGKWVEPYYRGPRKK